MPKPVMLQHEALVAVLQACDEPKMTLMQIVQKCLPDEPEDSLRQMLRHNGRRFNEAMAGEGWKKTATNGLNLWHNPQFQPALIGRKRALPRNWGGFEPFVRSRCAEGTTTQYVSQMKSYFLSGQRGSLFKAAQRYWSMYLAERKATVPAAEPEPQQQLLPVFVPAPTEKPSVLQVVQQVADILEANRGRALTPSELGLLVGMMA